VTPTSPRGRPACCIRSQSSRLACCTDHARGNALRDQRLHMTNLAQLAARCTHLSSAPAQTGDTGQYLNRTIASESVRIDMRLLSQHARPAFAGWHLHVKPRAEGCFGRVFHSREKHVLGFFINRSIVQAGLAHLSDWPPQARPCACGRRLCPRSHKCPRGHQCSRLTSWWRRSR